MALRLTFHERCSVEFREISVEGKYWIDLALLKSLISSIFFLKKSMTAEAIYIHIHR